MTMQKLSIKNKTHLTAYFSLLKVATTLCYDSNYYLSTLADGIYR